MEQAGFAEHRNIAVEYRWADGRDELPARSRHGFGAVRTWQLLSPAVAIIAVTAAKRATERFPSFSFPVLIQFVAGSLPA